MKQVHKKVAHHLKHLFIPHEHNDYKPHFFREGAVAILLGTSLTLFSLSAGSAYIARATDFGKGVIASVLIDLANHSRISENLTILKHSLLLNDAALLKAEDMIKGDYFSHDSPTGITPWHWFDRAGYSFVHAGENLAVDYFDSESVDKAWLNSPTHRANILNYKYKDIGIAVMPGSYKGHDTIYVVQMFGSPLSGVKEEMIETPKIALKQKEEDPKPILKVEEINPEVKGDSINIASSTFKNVIITEEYKTESDFLDKALFYGPKYINMAFVLLFSIIFIATLLLIFIEIKKQHPKHIAYAVLLLIILLILMYFNVNYFELSFKAF